MTDQAAMIQYLSVNDVKKAILNWQNAVGGDKNGQLEAFLGISIGYINDIPDNINIPIGGFSKVVERTRTLLRDNHPTLIKVWLARNEVDD